MTRCSPEEPALRLRSHVVNDWSRVPHQPSHFRHIFRGPHVPRFNSTLCLSHLHMPHCRLSHYPLIEMLECHLRIVWEPWQLASTGQFKPWLFWVFLPGAVAIASFYAFYRYSNSHTLHRHSIANTISHILHSLYDRAGIWNAILAYRTRKAISSLRHHSLHHEFTFLEVLPILWPCLQGLPYITVCRSLM